MRGAVGRNRTNEMNIQSHGRIAAFAAPWFRVLSAFILIGSSAAAFAGEEKTAATRFVIHGDPITSISIRAISLHEMILILLSADRAAKSNRFQRWIVKDGLTLASRKSESKYPIKTMVEFNINDPNDFLFLTFDAFVHGYTQEDEKNADAGSAEAELNGLLNATARRARMLFGADFVVDSIKLDVEMYPSHRNEGRAGLPAIRLNVQSTRGKDENPSTFLMFLAVKNQDYAIHLPHSTIKYLPQPHSPYDPICRDGYDDAISFLGPLEKIIRKEGDESSGKK